MGFATGCDKMESNLIVSVGDGLTGVSQCLYSR